MARLVHISLVLSALLFLSSHDVRACWGRGAQVGESQWPHSVPMAVKSALDSGDVSLLAGHLGGSVELQLPDYSGIFSKKQGEMILSKFLSLHRKMVYSVDHEEALGEATLTIGKLVGDDAAFSVYIILHPAGDSRLIKQLRIEEQK